MWQLKIIIEMSSRKELLGPIWSLPRDQAAFFPPHTFLLCPGWWGQCGGSLLCRGFQTTPDVIYSCRGFCLQHGILISLQLRGAS